MTRGRAVDFGAQGAIAWLAPGDDACPATSGARAVGLRPFDSCHVRGPTVRNDGASVADPFRLQVERSNPLQKWYPTLNESVGVKSL